MSETRENTLQYDETTPVLIVGGSLVGLSMSLFLSQQGISSLLVERHPGTSIHPRLAGLSPRTLELYRSAGVEEGIRRVELPLVLDSTLLRVESLVGRELDRLMEDLSELATPASPVRGSLIAQDVLEPVLRAHAERMGGDLRYGTELTAFEQDEDGISATIRERTSGVTRRIRARFLVAADGGQSGIRKQLGIGQHGAGTLSHIISIIFEADLMKLFRERNTILCFVSNQTLPFAALTAYPSAGGRPDVFRLDVPYDPAAETAEAYDEARCLALIRAAVGVPDLSARLKAVLPYEMAARVSDRFQDGRVFLVGDAARVQPPSGGLGGNTGIAEAHNLAWKLALCLRGAANPPLLATYDQERRSLADFTAEQVTLLSQQRQQGHEAITVDTLALSIGYRYKEGALIPQDDASLPLAQHPELWTGQSGTRAPHVEIVRNGERISTLDLFGRHFVLLVGASSQDWLAAAQQTARALNITLETYQIGRDLVEANGNLHAAYGITTTGAVLVRPDGFVAWHSQGAQKEPVSVLSQVLASLLYRQITR